MAKYEVKQDHDMCIGCGACAAVCPSNWKIGDDGKASPIKSKSDDDCNMAAADGCPVKCIHVKKV